MPPATWILGFLGALGVVVAWRGIRGAPRLSAPHCSRCRYDLRVSLRESREQCPECGAMLAGRNAVRFGRHPRSVARIGIGLLLLMPLMLYATNVVVKRKTCFRWQQIKPTSSLIAALDDGPKAARDAGAVLELRYMAGELSDDQVAEVVEKTITTQARGGGTNLVHGADGVIQMAHRDGRIDERQWRRLVEVLFARPPVIRCRSNVRAGQHLQFSVQASSTRLANLMRLRPQVRIDQATFAGRDVPLESGGRIHAGVDAGSTPGAYTLELEVEVTVVDASNRMAPMPTASNVAPKVQHRWRTTIEAPVTVLPADVYPFERVDDPATVTELRESIEVVGAAASRSASGQRRVELTLQMRRPEHVGLSYVVFVRAGDGDHRIGNFYSNDDSFSCSCRALNRASQHTGLLRMLFEGDVPLADAVDRIDVILRPDLDGAERDQRLERLLEAEIVIDDVRLER